MVFLSEVLGAVLAEDLNPTPSSERNGDSDIRPQPVPGFRPCVSVGHYLAALGLAAAIGSVDPDARTTVGRNTFTVSTQRELGDLVEEIERSWAPAPVVTAHNSDTGLRPASLPQRPTERAVDALLATSSPRLAAWREAYHSGRAVWEYALGRGYIDRGGKIVDKVSLATAARNMLPDDALGWCDATAIVWGPDSGSRRIIYPAVTGWSGGNFGRYELARWAVAAMLAIDAGVEGRGKKARPVSLFPAVSGSAEHANVQNPWFPQGASWWRFALALHGATMLGTHSMWADRPTAPWQTTVRASEPSGVAEIYAPLWDDLDAQSVGIIAGTAMLAATPAQMCDVTVHGVHDKVRWVWDSDMDHYVGGSE